MTRRAHTQFCLFSSYVFFFVLVAVVVVIFFPFFFFSSYVFNSFFVLLLLFSFVLPFCKVTQFRRNESDIFLFYSDWDFPRPPSLFKCRTVDRVGQIADALLCFIWILNEIRCRLVLRHNRSLSSGYENLNGLSAPMCRSERAKPKKKTKQKKQNSANA